MPVRNSVTVLVCKRWWWAWLFVMHLNFCNKKRSLLFLTRKTRHHHWRQSVGLGQRNEGGDGRRHLSADHQTDSAWRVWRGSRAEWRWTASDESSAGAPGAQLGPPVTRSLQQRHALCPWTGAKCWRQLVPRWADGITGVVIRDGRVSGCAVHHQQEWSDRAQQWERVPREGCEGAVWRWSQHKRKAQVWVYWWVEDLWFLVCLLDAVWKKSVWHVCVCVCVRWNECILMSL